jgi:hypothetical protein
LLLWPELPAHLSYSHMRELAQGHDQSGWHAHAFSLSVDGIEIVASLVLRADRRNGRESAWLPWAALVIGTIGSLAANIATAGPGTISKIIAGWPALALLIAVKLLSTMLDYHATGHHPHPSPQPLRPARAATTAATGTISPSRFSRPAARTVKQPASFWPGRAPSTETGAAPAPPAFPVMPAAHGTVPPSPASGPGTVPDLPPAIAAPLPAARDGLRRDGQVLTRDALAARLHRDGHRVRNARLTPLLSELRAEPVCPTVADAGI